MANPEFRFRLRDHFGNPARWPKTLNDMLIERTFELIEISPPVRRALEGNRHGDNELDLTFSNRGMVQDLINYYDSLVGSFAALEGMPEQTWPDDLQRWNRQRVRARRRPLREAINQARSFAETDLAALRRLLVERHHVAATETGPSETYVRPARGRGAINEPVSDRGNRAGFPVASGEILPVDELSRRLAETLQVEDDRQNQDAMTDASQRLAEDLQREEADQQRRAAAEASDRLINQFREEDRRQKQAEDEASRRLVKQLRDEGLPTSRGKKNCANNEWTKNHASLQLGCRRRRELLKGRYLGTKHQYPQEDSLKGRKGETTEERWTDNLVSTLNAGDRRTTARRVGPLQFGLAVGDRQNPETTIGIERGHSEVEPWREGENKWVNMMTGKKSGSDCWRAVQMRSPTSQADDSGRTRTWMIGTGGL